MRRSIFAGISIAILSFGSFASGAVAQQRTVAMAAQANATTAVLSIPSWDGSCRFAGYPHVSIVAQPSHGRLAIGRATRLVVPAGNCAGKTVKGTVLYYTPKAGYRGADRASIRVWDVNRRNFVQANAAITVR